MALFAVLALLLWLLMGARRPWLVLGTACLIGLADEWAQLSLPGRQAGLDDLFADAAGAVLMLLCLTRVARSAWVTDARGELR